MKFEPASPDLNGLRFDLSEVERPHDAGDRPPQADATPLSTGQLQRLLDRLPDLADTEPEPFKLRAQSEPPPRTGVDTQQAWPPLDAPDVVPDTGDGALTVLRYAPEGDIDLAPHLSITFNQPMIAITSHDEASRVVPVTLEPDIEGTWRWVGTKTLLFEPDPRLPMATSFTALVPEGTASATGNALSESLKWTFQTPPPRATDVWPRGTSIPLQPVLVWSFDQRIDERMATHVELRAGNSAVALRVATQAEIDAHDAARTRIERAPEGRTLAMVPIEPLSAGTDHTLLVPAGAPSAEGPRTTVAAQTHTFRTFDPLSVTDWGCWDQSGRCNPAGALSVTFNNLIDQDQDLAELITTDPPIERLKLSVSGRRITVNGELPADSRVTVSVDGKLTDVFGQTLGRSQTNTYRIGPHSPTLAGPGRDQLVLDPGGPAAVSVYSRNHESLEVEIHRVTAEHYPEIVQWGRTMAQRGTHKVPGDRVARTTLQVDTTDDTSLTESVIDLSPYLTGESGHFLVTVEPTKQPPEQWRRTKLHLWVQRTRLGITALADGQQVVGWVTDLATGEPVEGAEVRLLGAGQGATSTRADGLARLGPYDASTSGQAMVATLGTDAAVLPESASWWQRYGSWQKGTVAPSLRWFIFDDRGMVKPGETARIKGIVRPFTPLPGQGLRAFSGTVRAEWTASDSQGVTLGKGQVEIGETGSFDLEIDIPDTPNLGPASVTFSTQWDGGTQRGQHSFQIQEFRRPEFEVTASVDPRPYVLGEHAIATVEANYYAGGGLPAAPAQWNVRATPASYTPPGHRDFSFGPWSPWWRGGLPGSDAGSAQQLAGTTGPDGSHSVRIDLLAAAPPRPYQVSAEATVTDVNRQRWSASSGFLMHPANRYVGLRLERPFIDKGKRQKIEAIVVDIDGEIQTGVPIEIRVARQSWKQVRGEWQQVDEDPHACALTSAAEPVACEPTLSVGGSYKIVATVRDAEDRVSESHQQFWVSGGLSRPERSVAREDVLLVPDAEHYAVGDTARVLVQAPFSPAEALITLRQDGLLRTEHRTLSEPSTTLEIPIEANFAPGVHLSVELVGAAPRLSDDGDPLPGASKRVAYAGGELQIKVPPLAHTLAVELEPEHPEAAPGTQTHIAVQVRDAAGEPSTNTEIALWMVDESVLALSDYSLPDPLDVFYADRGPGVTAAHLRAMVTLADPDTIEGEAPGSGVMLERSGVGFAEDAMVAGAMAPQSRARASKSARGAPPPAPAPMADRDEASSPAQAPAIAVRTDFRATALFAPRVRTDAQGRARVPVTLPDSLTRYRIFAVAADSEVGFGTDEATVVARKPIMLRPSLPRFLNVGDRAELPFVVQNPSSEDMVVDLALRVSTGRVLGKVSDDLATAPDRRAAGLRFTVPAEDRREVRLPVGVLDAGTFAWQAAISSGAHTDAASDDLPIWTPATTEAFATYGTITDGAVAYPVKAPTDAWPQFGGLEVSLSSTELHSLTDGILYLNDYPYDCTEQIASRVLANAAMRDVLSAFNSPQLPTAEVLADKVQRDLDQIGRRQLRTGGFAYWSGQLDLPLASLHATHALIRARDKGWTPDAAVLDRALSYAKNIERHIPGWYSERARLTIRAYAAYVRYRAGDVDRTEALKLYGEGLKELPLEAQGWILPILHQAGQAEPTQAVLDHWNQRVTETAAGAQFAASYTDRNDYVLMHGSRRTDAVLLEALLEVRPDHDLNVKIVRALLGHRVQGRWSTTQENTFVLLALDRYFRIYEGVTPDFVARTWIDGGLVGQAAFRGRSAERSHLDVPMAWLADQGERSLVVGTEGSGRLYYRLGLRYAPGDLQLEPADHGFTIERRYEPVDDDADVTQRDDGTWEIRAGARVRVRVTMVAPARRTLVALSDPLPAGLEPLNPALAVSGAAPPDPDAQQAQRYWWWSRPWYSHQNLRDERAEAFADLVWPGVHEYVYTATATTPGRFIVPPPRVEEMYHPETFGRGATARVEIR